MCALAKKKVPRKFSVFLFLWQKVGGRQSHAFDENQVKTATSATSSKRGLAIIWRRKGSRYNLVPVLIATNSINPIPINNATVTIVNINKRKKPNVPFLSSGRGISQQHMLGEALGDIYGELLEMVSREPRDGLRYLSCLDIFLVLFWSVDYRPGRACTKAVLNSSADKMHGLLVLVTY